MRSTALLSLALAVSAAAQTAPDTQPRNFDEIHYFLRDRAAGVRFFEQAFGARLMLHPGRRPLEFIDILNLRPGEPSINVSAKGPYPGMGVLADPKRWQRTVVEPSPDQPPVYGVYWLGIRTPSLEGALRRVSQAGARVRTRSLRIPGEPKARAALVVGPDENLFAIVERPEPADPRFPFAFDHLQLLVKSVADNERFFTDLYAGEVTLRERGSAVMKIAGATLRLSEPEALGLRRAAVLPRDPAVFRYGVDHVSFLYEDATPAYQAARAKGRSFLFEPRPLLYFGEPTEYQFGVALSPDGLGCEMLSEKGRRGPRVVFDEREFVSRPDPSALPWVGFDGPGIPAGLQARVLRESPLGARAAIVRYPPGYALGAGGYHSSEVELLVLEGQLEAGPRTLGKGVYARVPAGALIPDVASPSGASVLQF